MCKSSHALLVLLYFPASTWTMHNFSYLWRKQLFKQDFVSLLCVCKQLIIRNHLNIGMSALVKSGITHIISSGQQPTVKAMRPHLAR